MPLSDTAHRHAVQVLRLKQGDLLRVFDGQGVEYQAEISQIAKRQSTITLLKQLNCDNESTLNITLLQAISRGERMDYAVQKAVELGVTKIIPVVTERCNVQLSNGRDKKRWAHWQGIMIAACEQSGRSVLPELSPVTTLEALTKLSLLIGPEGGLSEQELEQVQAANFQAVKFGPRILRTETATVASLAVIQTLWGDLG